MKHARILLALLLPMTYIHSTILWDGVTLSHPVQNDASIVSVTDQDLIISGDVELPLGNTTITAITEDVNVYFVGGPNPADTTIRANDNALLSNLSNLNLVTAAGRKIIFHIDPSNVRFRGTNNEPGLPLMMFARGNLGGSGEVEFLFEQDHKTLQFTSRPDSGGCKFYIERLNNTAGAPKVFFQTPHSANKVIIGDNGSLLGMKIDGVGSNSIYEGFVFDATGAPGSNATLVIKSFGSIGLQTTP